MEKHFSIEVTTLVIVAIFILDYIVRIKYLLIWNIQVFTLYVCLHFNEPIYQGNLPSDFHERTHIYMLLHFLPNAMSIYIRPGRTKPL